MNLDDVRRAMALPRPGRRAQARLSPRPRPGDVYPLPPDTKTREAGVLLLLYPRRGPDDLAFLLTVRTDTVDAHKGQISLPGGAQEEGETIEGTALREAAEELGIDSARVQVLGALSPLFIPVSGFRVTPIVAYLDRRPETSPAPDEVVAVVETPLDTIVDERHISEESWELNRYSAVVPFFLVDGHKVWGATAMILGEFGEMLRTIEVGKEHGIS